MKHADTSSCVGGGSASRVAQLDLFAELTAIYRPSVHASALPELDNRQVYSAIAERLGVDRSEFDRREPVGASGQRHSLWKRKIRFGQQTLKHMGVIERVAGERGVWRLTEAAGKGLSRAGMGVRLVGFSTELGACIWGSNFDALHGLEEPIVLMLSSSPYPIARARAYGGPTDAEYVEFMVRSLEPVVRHLAPGGSIVLNMSNDVFERGSPARSISRERVIIALRERLGIFKMDEMVWANRSKPPSPVQYASKERCHLNSGWEPLYVLSNDPIAWKSRADNRRVLQPHTERQLALIARGGEQREAVYGDGAYRLRHGSFGNPTQGRIPRNVFEAGHNCSDTRALRRHAKELGLPAHGAMFPTSLPAFFIDYLSKPQELVVDIWGGSSKTGLAAERAGRRWLTIEWMLEYVRTSAELFRGFSGFNMSPALADVGGIDA
ncbi:site-specific DNA-methyltransferase [Paraburkholderia sp. J8-2]|uniref:site-specific DNA-methyltransferase n=1 Tax=Paraburkholderia sp. J8-2 TaxID=2805440 RepID=UPI002AB69485|nr:site-specific DNA-methyltransferase [Paraburkholderia sp. J8-2]